MDATVEFGPRGTGGINGIFLFHFCFVEGIGSVGTSQRAHPEPFKLLILKRLPFRERIQLKSEDPNRGCRLASLMYEISPGGALLRD